MSEYSQNFEQEDVKINSSFKKEELDEEDHHLRISLELHSVKDLPDTYNLYCKFTYKLLGTRRTQPVLIRKLVENRIENAFQAQEFFMARSSLYPYLASTPLQIELWHSDKYSIDSQVGLVTLNMEEVLRAPLKKTNSSFLRVLDTWCDICNPEAIGAMRIIIYLEDLGPKRNGAVLANAEKPEDYKAVWELELWKRAEETIWKSLLKNKEQEYIALLAIDWQDHENKREASFQKLSAEVSGLEAKLRTKTLDLLKREKNIIKLEEAKKLKINESVRVMALKEEEIQSSKSKINEILLKHRKDIKPLETQLDQLKQEIQQSEENLRKLKRDQDFASVSKLKEEIDLTIKKNLDFKKSIDLFTVQKENLKSACESTRTEFLRVLCEFEEEKKSWEEKEREKITSLEQEIDRIKAETLAFRITQEKDIRCSCSCAKITEFVKKEEESPEISRLRKEIDSLIGSGMYNEDDPIIQELGKQIKMIRTV